MYVQLCQLIYQCDKMSFFACRSKCYKDYSQQYFYYKIIYFNLIYQFINSNLGTDIQFQLTMRKHELQDSINPHRFVQTPVKSTQKITQLYSKTTNNQTNQQKNFTQRQSHDKTQRVKITTEVLLDKILQLQVKIKTFQQQRKVSQLLNKSATQYQSINTQPVAVFGSIKRNDINKNFNTTVQNQQNNTSQTIFKQIAARSIINPEHKITNNIYNDNLTQNKKQNNVKQEIDLLKKKLSVLENGKGLSNKMVKNNTGPYNFQIFQNKPQEKLCSQSRRQLGGKIVKRLGSKLSQSPTNIIRAQTEQSQNINAKKGGIRRQDSVMQMSRYSNISNFGHQNKKKDSSAIFRKNLGPAVVYKRQSSTTHISKYKTTQQNSFHDKIIALESRYAQQMFKNSYTAPIFQKYNREFNIPNLNFTPSPNSTSDELINLGKQTFRKFGYQINQNVILNVKKFKNCVLFSINAEQNILWHYEGKFYYGGWKTYINGQGQKFGKGIQFVPGKYKYKGSFQEGKKSGYGILIEQSGSIYIGNWFDGLKHGKGKLIQLDGSQYHGDWKSGKKSGYGRLFYKGVLQFEGNFVGGMKHGFGKETFQNGDYYEGQYLGNKFQGKGTYIWSSKAMFVGQFRDGKRHGRGIWRSGQANYDEYEGEYQEDNKNGYGIYKWASGAIYKGGFKNDLKHGQGSITYENGNLVRMIWNKGKVEKTLMDSKRIEQAKHQYPAPRTKLRKSSSTRSNLNLPSTTSLKSQRSLPKGLSLKKQLAHINYTQPSPKFQFRKKLSPNELLKFKNRTSSRSGLLSKLSSHSVRDPPYKSMQTSPSVKLKR